MPIAIAFIQGLFELVGLGGFLVGYFADIWWLMMLGGCLVVLDDVIEIGMGILIRCSRSYSLSFQQISLLRGMWVCSGHQQPLKCLAYR
jgi:hypothetical protein